jgi:hypothetical protein
VIPATFAARGNTQFDQEFLNLFRAETVSAYDWRDRIGDLCVAEYLAQLDTVHLVRYSTPLSLHFGMVAPSDYNLVFIKLIDVATLVFALGGGLLSRSLMKPKITASSSVGGERRIFLSTHCRSQVLISGGGKSSVIPVSTPRLRLLWRTL